MNPVYINGIGILSRCAQNPCELIHAIIGDKFDFTGFSEKIPFKSVVPTSKLRRCSRYTKMAVSAAALAAHDGNLTPAEAEYTGTILSTGFGAVESNITFSDSVLKGNPALCSPTVFSSTVPNSCVGQICIINGYKGFSTILTAGDPIEYSALLIQTKRAENILCGSVEEYNSELEKAIRCSDIAKDISMSEGAVIFMLSAEPTENTYCIVTAFSSVSLPAYPYLHQIDIAYSVKLLAEALAEIAAEKIPDLILMQRNGTYFDNIERTAIEKVFGNKVILASPKKIFGETLGSGYMLNVAVGAVILKENIWPSELINGIIKDTDIQTVLAAGLDAHGNYITALLEVQT